MDDDARYRELLPHLLGALADAECCPDEATALELLRAQRFDWVLLDVRLGGADGFAVLARILALADPPRVVLHTGLAIVDGRRRAIGAGAVDLLEKPLSVPYLAALMRSEAPTPDRRDR